MWGGCSPQAWLGCPDRGTGQEGIVGVARPPAVDGNIARASARSAIGTPVTGVVFSFLVSHRGVHQTIVRPSTDQDFTLPNLRRIDGAYDALAPHEEMLAVYDDVGFAATPMLWRDVGIRRYCQWSLWVDRARAFTDDRDSPPRDLKERLRYVLLKKGDHLRECSPRVITGSG
jgi:hypothetical protein